MWISLFEIILFFACGGGVISFFKLLNFLCMKKILSICLFISFSVAYVMPAHSRTICIQAQTPSNNTKKCIVGTDNDRCAGPGTECAGMSDSANPRT